METEKKSKRAKKGWGIGKEHLEETKAEVVHKIGVLTSVQREDIMTSDARFQRFQEECVAEAIRKCQSQPQPQPHDADDAAIRSWCVAVVKGVFGGAVREIENNELNAEEKDALSRWDKLFELRKAFKLSLKKKPATAKSVKPTKAK